MISNSIKHKSPPSIDEGLRFGGESRINFIDPEIG